MLVQNSSCAHAQLMLQGELESHKKLMPCPLLLMTSVNLTQVGHEEAVKYLWTFISYFPSLGLGSRKGSPSSMFTRGRTEEQG